jgi:FtsP/CotA-like multicopper oxidase with cupredoxin domain
MNAESTQLSLPADLSVTPPTNPTGVEGPAGSFSRRGFLRSAAIAGGGLVVASVAACAPTAANPSWTYGPSTPPPAGGSPGASAAAPPVAASAAPSADASHDAHSPAPSGSPAPADHDAEAKAVVTRFLDGEYGKVEGAGNQPKEPKLDGDVKVFDFTVDEIQHRIDAEKDPVNALGFDAMWPGPRVDVIEGDKIRAVFKNNMQESTGIHFHGQRLPNNMDGVPLITQDPIHPGDSFTYEFTAKTTGSHMYHSHHNATDQVGRGLLGAFIVHPRDPAKRYDKLYGVTQDIVWISNDSLGGFTINGRGFPATAPIVATLGETIAIRFMNEGSMMHPWHLHGMPMHVVARDGYPLPNPFFCDTLGVNPGERWDVIIKAEEPGAWAFHCHILPHAEGPTGMFGMVTALVVNPATASAPSILASALLPSLTRTTAGGPIRSAARAGGSTAYTCTIPT